MAAGELARYGVRVNAIAPTARTRLTLATPGIKEIFAAPVDEDAFDMWSPANISPLVAYLAAKDCPVTGQVYTVHGGNISRLGGWHPTDVATSTQAWTIASVSEHLQTWI